MQKINMRLDLLRGEMLKENIDYYIVLSDDFHSSEYVDDYFKVREFLSGFSGSAGTLLISLRDARLWTDGRYFLQAADQLRDSEIILMKQGEPGVPELEDYLKANVLFGQTVAYDGRTVSSAFSKKLSSALGGKDISFKSGLDLAGRIWTDRSPFPAGKITLLSERYSGKSVADKLTELRASYRAKGCKAVLISSLDDIAWLYNYRGSDVLYTPVAMAYTVVNDNEAIIYIAEEALSPEIREALSPLGISFKPYFDIYDDVKLLEGPVMVDDASVNETLVASLSQPVTCENPTSLAKAVKNEIEIENFRRTHIIDGIALTKTIFWLKKLSESGSIHAETEKSVEAHLTELRSAQDGFISLSFDSIVATGEHGAIVHYEPTDESNRNIEDGFLLIDTGGHYLTGTTDVTRTVSIGEISDEMKASYTAVLRGNLALGAARFPDGTLGTSLDVLARKALWDMGFDYNHGTGHGVGYILSVHEGPNSIRKLTPKAKVGVPLVPGMITSNEPGLYITGKYGIRIENLILTVEDKPGFNAFETLTLAPYDRASILPEMLTEDELSSLNSYNRRLYEVLAPYLTDEERNWLEGETAAF